jgi:hypothetical protein
VYLQGYREFESLSVRQISLNLLGYFILWRFGPKLGPKSRGGLARPQATVRDRLTQKLVPRPFKALPVPFAPPLPDHPGQDKESNRRNANPGERRKHRKCWRGHAQCEGRRDANGRTRQVPGTP